MPRLSDETNTLNVLPPTKSQYQILTSWLEGKFIADLDDPLAPEALPDALDRLALEACAGGPFYPGIEVGPILAEPAHYISPFRLDADKLGPGQVTQGNAVPWQADFLACGFEAQRQLGWWPAQRPDKVLIDAASGQVERWARGVQKYADMVEHWHELGIVVPTPGPDGTQAYVESERLLPDT